MRLSQLLGPDLRSILENEDAAELKDALEEVHPEALAEIVAELPAPDAVAIMRALPVRCIAVNTSIALVFASTTLVSVAGCRMSMTRTRSQFSRGTS